MGAEEVKVVSPEQIDALMEKLGSVQDMLKTNEEHYRAFLKAVEEKEQKEEEVEKAATISVEDIAKAVNDAVAPLKAELEEIKKTPFNKGVQDADDPKQKDDKIEKGKYTSDLTKSVKLAFGQV